MGGSTVVSGTEFVPEVSYNGQWYPICGHYFWDNDAGATMVCKNLGFATGTHRKTYSPYEVDSMPVGKCKTGEALDGCTTGGNAWGDFNYRAGFCKKGKSVGITVTCTGQHPSGPVGLIVKVNELSPNAYRPHKLKNNMKVDNVLQINFKSNQAPVLLDFTFVYDNTVRLPGGEDWDADTKWHTGDEVKSKEWNFMMSVLDFDTEPESMVAEVVCVNYNRPEVGRGLDDIASRIPGLNNFPDNNRKTAAIEAVQTRLSCTGTAGQSLSLISKEVGYGCDNPTDSFELAILDKMNQGRCAQNADWKNSNYPNIDQAARTVDLAFRQSSSFQLLVEMTCNWDNEKCATNGRNLVIGPSPCRAAHDHNGQAKMVHGDKKQTGGGPVVPGSERRLEETKDSYMHFWGKELKYYSEAV